MEATTGQRVAANVRAEMARRRVSQTAMAKHLGIAQAAVSRRLTGQVPFDVNELASVAGFLGLSLGDLMPAPVVAA